MVDIAKVGTFVQNSPYPAWLATGNGDCVYGNPALERLTGLNSKRSYKLTGAAFFWRRIESLRPLLGKDL